MTGICTLILHGEKLQLLPQKAIFWPAQKTLFIADTHFGKITHFRKAGIALPDTAAFENFRKLRQLLETTLPEKVYFLGDLFHSELNIEWFGFKELLSQFPQIQFHLVEGNHDILDESSYAKANFKVHTTPILVGGFLLSHEPIEKDIPEGIINFCGHLHPGVRLVGSARQTMRLPCFYLSTNQLIFPAFGAFTGLYLLKPKKEDKIFVCSGAEVLSF